MRKSVKWGFLTLSILLCILGWGAYSLYKPKPSLLEVVVEKRAVQIEPVMFIMKKWGRTAADDTEFEPVALAKKDSPIVIADYDEIKLAFKQLPISVQCYLWDIDTGKLVYKGLNGHPLDVQDTSIASGDYAMEIRAKWKNGYALYNTRIIVKDDLE